MKSSPFSEPTRWHSNLSQWRGTVPARLGRWISYSHSMTKRMQHHCQTVRIEVIASHVGMPTFNEARLLQLAPRRAALIREIIMWCDEQPWLYGRTIAPLATVDSELPRLYRLGTVAIGKLLFRHRNMQRSPFAYAKLLPGQALYQETERWQQSSAKWLLARHSEFKLSEKKLLLTEIFLPDMINYLGGQCD